VDFLDNPQLWRYATIPFVAAVVGWATNWVAIWMTFNPVEFRGVRPFLGWQGIVPAKAAKMAGIFVDSTMARLGTLSEVFERMDPAVIADHVAATVSPRAEELTDEVMRRAEVYLWDNLPEPVRGAVYERVREELPGLVRATFEDIDRQIESLVDLKHLIVSRLVAQPALLNRLFLECGAAELRFIIRSGLYFGFLFGLVQLAVWIVAPARWVLPVFGLFVGLATNWIALNLVFRPLEPVQVGPWRVQGLFLRRQPEVAATWSRLVSTEILTLHHLVAAMLDGPRADRTRTLIRRHVKPLVDLALGPLRGVAQAAVGLRGFAGIKEGVGETAIEVALEPFEDRTFVLDRASAVASDLTQRMRNMPPAQFQDLLRPCFQEDELKLILLGGALGLLAGFLQLQWM
jgi:uncharacterized membrane protein YheB (UPF0754 family)